jgi:hypothetical protein
MTDTGDWIHLFTLPAGLRPAQEFTVGSKYVRLAGAFRVDEDGNVFALAPVRAEVSPEPEDRHRSCDGPKYNW